MHNRYEYSAIPMRPDFSWPGGKRLAMYVCVNVEIFGYNFGIGPEIGMANPPPNTRSFAWRDFGNRVGVWRVFELLDKLNWPACHNLNSLICDYAPAIAERIKARSDEVIGHGRTNSERLSSLLEGDEKRIINEATARLTEFFGRQPKGWLGPWLAETGVTIDLLQEAGYEYILDWVCDDQPFWMRTRNGRILSVPYTLDINDSPTMAFRNLSARDFADMIVDHFEELLEESRTRSVVCPIVLHPYLIGQAFRMRAFRRALDHCIQHKNWRDVWMTTPGEIARYCYSLPPGIIQ